MKHKKKAFIGLMAVVVILAELELSGCSSKNDGNNINPEVSVKVDVPEVSVKVVTPTVKVGEVEVGIVG
jgi:hypothetical protein